MTDSVDSLALLWSQWLAHDGWPVLARPEALWLLLVPLALAWWRRRRGQRVADYADPDLRPWAFAGQGDGGPRGGGAAWIATPAWGLFWLFAVLALADPRIPHEGGEAASPKPSVLFVVDGSAAMTGRDVAPSRIERADLLIELVAERLSGHRIGLLRSVDTAGLLLPPSQDHGLLDFYADRLPGLTAGAPRVANSAAALQVAATMRALDGGAVVWLTSADERQFADEAGTQVLEAAEALAERDIPVIAVTLGRETTPLYRDDAPMRDGENRVVTSTPAPDRVAEVAEFTGGTMLVTDVLSEDAARLAQRIARLPAPSADDEADGHRSLAVLALWVAFAALLIHLWLEWGHSRRPLVTAMATLAAVLLPAVFTLAGAAPVVDAEMQRTQLQEGQAHLEAGEFIRAQTAFDRASGYAARLGGGLAAYRRGDFPHAVERLQAAAWLAETDRQRRLALFNLGNALVLAARYRAAVSAYDAVLALDPDHGPARQNRQIAVSLANVAGQREQSEEQPGFRGFDSQRPDPIDETQGAQMSEEFLEAEGSGRGGRVADQPAAGGEFVLNESLLQGARKKLERLDDRPQPPLRSLLRQQPYKGVVSDRLEGEEGER